MAVDVYNKVTWVNGTAPSINQANLNHLETGVKNNNAAIIGLESYVPAVEVLADNAEVSATNSATSATNSANSATSSANSATISGTKAVLSESWAVGGTGTRTGEDANNAKFWSDRAQAVAGVDIATDTVAGLVLETAEVQVSGTGAMSISETDTQGLIVTAGQRTPLQGLVNYFADWIKNKLVKVTQISQTNVNNSAMVPSSALLYSINDSLTTPTTSTITNGIATFVYTVLRKIGKTVELNTDIIMPSSYTTYAELTIGTISNSAFRPIGSFATDITMFSTSDGTTIGARITITSSGDIILYCTSGIFISKKFHLHINYQVN